MFLKLNFLGLTPVVGYTPIQPVIPAYDTIKIYGGNTGCTIDKVWSKNELINQAILDAYDKNTYSPIWDAYTNVISEFNDSLESGNIFGLSSPILYWDIYREDPDSSQLTFLDSVDVSVTSFEDFKALVGSTYKYYLFGRNANQLTEPIESNEIESDYWGYYIIDTDNNIAYRFDADSQSSDFTTTDDFTEHPTNLKYNAVSKGTRDFIGGSIQAIIRTENISDFIQPNLLLSQLHEFISSSRPKLLKDKRGRIWNVETYGYKERQLVEGLAEQILISEFNFIEVGEV